LNYIIYQEGHVEPGGAYKYYLKDHLGSVRMVVNTTGTGGTIEQQTDYYPFGMTIAEYNGSIIDYRYNGKELQDDLINSKKLDWYDYGARMYDPQIGRFHTVDPLTEKFYFLTPYQYGSNNPVTNIDIDGLEGVPFNAPWLIAKWAEFKARAQEVGGAASRLLTGTSGSNMPENKIPGTNLSNKTLATWNDVGIVGQGVADLAEGTANVIGNIPGFETAVEIGGIVINAAEGDLEGANPYLIGLSSPLLSGTQLKLGKAGLEEIVDLAAGSGTPRVKSTKQLRKEWEEINGEAWPKDSETGRNMVAAHKDALADGGADAGSNITPMTNSAHIQDHKEKGDFIRWGKRRRNE
jgi:RHS repeat-associated protein